MADVTVGKSEIHGEGVFACRCFKAGETILLIDDSRVVDGDHPLLPELGECEHHCDHLADGKVVLMQSPERYINSSCSPNSYVKTIGGVRRVVALADVEAGEEVTYDYIINCHDGEVWECHCGKPGCRGTIPSSYFELPLDLQLRYLPLLDDWFRKEHEGTVKQLERLAGSARARPCG
jgi:hypothetical protein